MTIRAKALAFFVALLALVALGQSPAAALPGEPGADICVSGTPMPPGAEAVHITAPMGASFFIQFTDEFGNCQLIGSGLVGPIGMATVMAPAVGVTPVGARFLTVHVAWSGNQYVFIVDSTDPLFLWQ